MLPTGPDKPNVPVTLSSDAYEKLRRDHRAQGFYADGLEAVDGPGGTSVTLLNPLPPARFSLFGTLATGGCYMAQRIYPAKISGGFCSTVTAVQVSTITPQIYQTTYTLINLNEIGGSFHLLQTSTSTLMMNCVQAYPIAGWDTNTELAQANGSTGAAIYVFSSPIPSGLFNISGTFTAGGFYQGNPISWGTGTLNSSNTTIGTSTVWVKNTITTLTLMNFPEVGGSSHLIGTNTVVRAFPTTLLDSNNTSAIVFQFTSIPSPLYCTLTATAVNQGTKTGTVWSFPTCTYTLLLSGSTLATGVQLIGGSLNAGTITPATFGIVLVQMGASGFTFQLAWCNEKSGGQSCS